MYYLYCFVYSIFTECTVQYSNLEWVLWLSGLWEGWVLSISFLCVPFYKVLANVCQLKWMYHSGDLNPKEFRSGLGHETVTVLCCQPDSSNGGDIITYFRACIEHHTKLVIFHNITWTCRFRLTYIHVCAVCIQDWKVLVLPVLGILSTKYKSWPSMNCSWTRMFWSIGWSSGLKGTAEGCATEKKWKVLYSAIYLHF